MVNGLNQDRENVALPYSLDMAWYAAQADRFGTSRRLPMTGMGGGPGGYGSPLCLMVTESDE